MRSTEGGDDWDFSPVIDLIRSLSYHHQRSKVDVYGPLEQVPSTTPAGSTGIPNSIDSRETGLGNFDELWRYLGRPLHVPCNGESSENEHGNTKGVRWRDEIDGADLADNEKIEDSSWLQGLTKAQRKKVRRRERRNALANALSNGRTVPSSSGTESEREAKGPATPDRKAIIHDLLDRPLPDGNARNGMSVLKRPTSVHDDKLQKAKQLAADVLHVSRTQHALAVAAARKAKLLNMLKERFIDERHYLNDFNLLQHTSPSHLNPAEGIHIFVDASNIMIGFHDALKLSRSVALTTRMRRQPISFHSLSLILSRGRPTAKRIVVGSDNFPEMAEAKLIGYETNILDRVHKAKELTPRQKKYSNGSGNGTQSAGSGSETTTAVQYAPEKWVEQAVDEILHLKMMESVVDAAEPSTMVLATGDAAEAEYSGGFLKMVERALQKGWSVELASFRHNTSGAYRKREFRQKWGQRFKIVELDEFVECLHVD